MSTPRTAWLLAGSAALTVGCASARSPPVLPSFEGARFVGHTSPDTDSIASAIGAALLYGGVATRSGSLNAESRYLLKRFGVAAPVLFETEPERPVVLLDHNQRTQAPPGLEGRQVVGIIDHHALREQAFVLDEPTHIDIRPWGSTCTLVAHALRSHQRAVPPPIAGVLLGGILSDTLHLTSPTTTEIDRQMVLALAADAGVEDTEALFSAMIRAKSDLAAFTDREVLLADFKIYVLDGRRVGFGVAETITPETLRARQPALRAAMRSVAAEKRLDLFFFSITDVAGQRAYLFGAGEAETELGEAAFGVGARDSVLILEGLTSRKRQMIPILQRGLRKERSRSGKSDPRDPLGGARRRSMGRVSGFALTVRSRLPNATPAAFLG